MGMNITQVGPRKWLLLIRVWKDNREHSQRHTFTGTRKAAEEKYFELRQRLREIADASVHLSATKIVTFGQALDYYYEARKNNLSAPYAFDEMKRDLSHVPIEKLREHFRRYWVNLRHRISRQTGKPLANTTVNHYTIMAKAALNLCVTDGLLDSNPLQKMEILKVIPRDRVFTDLERQRLINIVDQEAPHLSAVIRLAFEVPCRKSELSALTREHLDLINNVIYVPDEIAKCKSGSWKPIPPGWLTTYFRTLPPPEKCPWLFFRYVKKHDKYLPLGDFDRAMRRCLNIAGLKNAHFHDTRHNAATELLNAGTPERALCQIAGWKSGNMLRTYYHRDGLLAAQSVVWPQDRNTLRSQASQ